MTKDTDVPVCCTYKKQQIAKFWEKEKEKEQRKH